jgi:hypothetical protein
MTLPLEARAPGKQQEPGAQAPAKQNEEPPVVAAD